jgi:hypothetical protein
MPQYSRKKLVVGVCIALAIVIISFYSYASETYQVFDRELTVFNVYEGLVVSKTILIPNPWISPERLTKATLQVQLESVGDTEDRPVRIYFNNKLVMKPKIMRHNVPNSFEIDVTDFVKEYAGRYCEIYIMMPVKPKAERVSLVSSMRWQCTASIRVEYFAPYNLPIQAALLVFFIGVSCYGQKVNFSNIVKWGFLWFASLMALLGFTFVVNAYLFAMPRLLESGGCLIFLSSLVTYLLYAPPGSLKRACNIVSTFILAPLQKALAFLYRRTAPMRHDYIIIFLGGIICLTGLLLGTAFKELFILGASITLGGCMWLIVKMFSSKREGR